MKDNKHSLLLLKTILASIAILITLPLPTRADIIDSLKNAINEQSRKILSIDEEIKQVQQKVAGVQKTRKNLEGDVASLQRTENQLQSEINKALSGVTTAEGRISSLQQQISEKEQKISEYKNSVAQSIRTMSAQDDVTLLEVFLAEGTLSDFWSQADTLTQFQVSVDQKMTDLRKLKEGLGTEIIQEKNEQATLLSLRREIEGKREAVEYARSEKNKLLTDARGQEKAHQATLSEKKKLKATFEQELNSYESRLNIALNPETIPVAQSSTLNYPVSGIITQEFGYTAFAAGGAYGGKGHNGMDFGVPIGTPVKAARSGIIKGAGDTDSACRSASYGKWVAIDHDNGLSTLYGHLSVISVSSGQSVTSGQIIGYSGNTGYSTGPHLHFTVFASDGMRIQGLPSNSCPGSTFTLPVANPQAYLNPRKYLP